MTPAMLEIILILLVTNVVTAILAFNQYKSANHLKDQVDLMYASMMKRDEEQQTVQNRLNTAQRLLEAAPKIGIPAPGPHPRIKAVDTRVDDVLQTLATDDPITKEKDENE